MKQIAVLAIPLTLATCLLATGCSSPEMATVVQPPGTEAICFDVSGMT